MDTSGKFQNIQEYHSKFPLHIREMLEELRQAIVIAAPDADEVISYNMPAFKQHRVLVYYAAGKNHIGFYPTPEPIEAFKDDLTEYKTSKGAIQFSLDKPIPVKLVQKIVKYRIEDDIEQEKERKAKKK